MKLLLRNTRDVPELSTGRAARVIQFNKKFHGVAVAVEACAVDLLKLHAQDSFTVNAVRLVIAPLPAHPDKQKAGLRRLFVQRGGDIRPALLGRTFPATTACSASRQVAVAVDPAVDPGIQHLTGQAVFANVLAPGQLRAFVTFAGAGG